MILRQLSTQDLQLQKLIEIYRRAEIQIEKELTRKRALDLVDFAEQAALRRVRETLNEMTAQAEEQAPIALESFFDTTAESLTTTKTNVVQTLVNNYMGKIDEAAEVTFESAKEFLTIGRLAADEFRTLSLERVAESTAIGKGWRDAQRKLAIDLNNKGITAFTDKAGREWDLTSYCSMLTRTTARQAQTAAVLTESEQDLWQILPHGTTCPICAAYQGRVYSKSGNDPDYPPLASAFGKIDPLGSNDLTNTYLNIHPNCLCTLAPYTTAGKTDEEIQEDKDFSSFEKRPADVDYRTEQQRDEYRAKEKARAEYRNTKKQFEKYKAAGVDDMPVRLSTFEKNKRANTDKYKEWERKFREINKADKKAIEAVTEVAEQIPAQSPVQRLSSALERNHNAFIDRHNLNLVKSENNEFAFAKLPNLDERTATAFSDTIADLVDKYDTNLKNVVEMDKLEAFARKKDFAGLEPHLETAESTLKINPVLGRNYENYVATVKKSVETGYHPKIAESNLDKYVPTHEFAHSMLSTRDKIPTTRNWANMDYTQAKAARKELEKLYGEYKADITSLEPLKDKLYKKFYDGSITQTEWEELAGIEETLKGKIISKYAITNADEFMAEGFADALLGESPGEYANKVLELINKYFKK